MSDEFVLRAKARVLQQALSVCVVCDRCCVGMGCGDVMGGCDDGGATSGDTDD